MKYATGTSTLLSLCYCAVVLLHGPHHTTAAFQILQPATAVPAVKFTTSSSSLANSGSSSTTIDDADDDIAEGKDDNDDDMMIVVDVDYDAVTEPSKWNTANKRSNLIILAQTLRNKYGYLLNPLIVPRNQQMELFDAIMELEDDFIQQQQQQANSNSSSSSGSSSTSRSNNNDDVVSMLMGDWELICTIPILVVQPPPPTSIESTPSLLENEFIQNLFPSSLPLAAFTNKFVTITQRIRSCNMNNNNNRNNNNSMMMIDRVDHVIEVKPPNQLRDILNEVVKDNDESTPLWLQNLNLNPFKVKESKIILIHTAEVISPSNDVNTNTNNNYMDSNQKNDERIKLRLKLQSVVNNIAGNNGAFNLNPNGADIFAINIPSLPDPFNVSDELNDALGGSFITTYVDDEYRISRSDLLLSSSSLNNNNNNSKKNKPQQIRIFQKRRSGTTASSSSSFVTNDNTDDDNDMPDVDDIAIEAPSDVES